MRNEHGIGTKLPELVQGIVYKRCIRDHFVRYPGKVFDPVWDRFLRIDERRESFLYLAGNDLDRTDLDYPALPRVQTRRLKVEHDESIVCRMLPGAYSNIRLVIDDITFHSVYDLEIAGIVLRIPHIMERIGERLNYAVIGYRERLVTPVDRASYYVRYARYSVHVTHLRMTVEFHTLLG